VHAVVEAVPCGGVLRDDVQVAEQFFVGKGSDAAASWLF